MSCTISNHNQTALGCNVFIQELGQSVLMSISGPRNSERSPGLVGCQMPGWFNAKCLGIKLCWKIPHFYPFLLFFDAFPFKRPFSSGFPSAPSLPPRRAPGQARWNLSNDVTVHGEFILDTSDPAIL